MAAGDVKISYKASNDLTWIDAIFPALPDVLIGLDADGVPSVVTLGANLTLVNGVLTASGGGGGGTPGGSSGQVQYNAAGSFGGFTLGGDATLVASTGVLTLATVNGNVGAFGSATAAGTFTVNAKGLITAAASTTITPAVGSITGLGTNVATALAVAVGSAGAFITFNGNAGTPSALVGTNISGTAASLTAGTATVATTITAANEASDTTCFPVFVTAATGNLGAKTNAGLAFNSSTGVLTATGFSGPLTGNVTGTASVATTFTAANEASDTTCFPVFVTAATGDLGGKTNAGLAFNSSTGVLTTTGLASTSPAFTTSITTPSTTFAIANTTATTVNAFGATTTLNIGASATCILNFGGSTTASEFRFLEPSGSGTNYTAFKAVAQGASITYSLPPTVGGAGTFLTDAAGNGVLTWGTPAGSGDVVGPASATDNAVVRFDSTTGKLVQNSVVTIADTTGDIVTPGSITSGSGGGLAGVVVFGEGTAPSAAAADTIQLQAPANITTAYDLILPAASTTGFLLNTDASNVGTLSIVGSSGTGNVVRVTSATLVTPDLGTPSALVGTNITGTAAGLTAGTATVATTITAANEATDTTCFPVFVTAATGNLGAKTVASLTFNSNTGLLTATGLSASQLTSTVVTGTAPLVVASTTQVANLNAATAGTATVATTITAADETTDTSCFPVFVTAATGNLGPKTAASFTFNSNTGTLSATNVIATTAFLPDANDGAALGAAGTAFSDLFLAEGAVINWDSSDLTLTQTGNELALAGGNLDIGTNILRISGEIDIDSTPAADDTVVGPVTNDFNAGATVAQWDAVYMGSGGKWLLADSDAASTGGSVMICVACEAGSDTNPLKVALPTAIIRNDGWNWTPGVPLYVDTTTAGLITATQPSGADDVIRVIAYALSADVIYLLPASSHETHT